ncbi:hypothetical protein DFJ58DRAFT_813464, partial [Suillus subalutaceus]|uniref:uncharacterized protein n=1 Tax=Suillus subalutaceus TaxID=48586 RepID=UPI001B86089F
STFNVQTFTSYGGFIHPLISLSKVLVARSTPKFGLSVIAQDTIDADTTIVSCQFSLAIDVECALYALTVLFGESSLVDLQSWSKRQLICTYICLHWVFPNSSPIPDVLRHPPCLESLPPADALLTSLRFTPSELETFRGTNIYCATHDRQESWSTEWNKCRTFIHPINADWAERYICTEARDDSATISIISHTTTPLGEEVFNNYGLKANDELILGYGFLLPQNPDDKITPQLGGSSNDRSSCKRCGRTLE